MLEPEEKRKFFKGEWVDELIALANGLNQISVVN